VSAVRHGDQRRVARVVAQAKINLFLRVLAREASGYHQIETLFQRLDLGDDVVVRVGATERSIDCAGADTGPADRNLAWRAALAFADATGWPNGFGIEIEKRIPVGGGLGGGSADAGAVLRCLNALAPSPLAPSELLALAAPLGADVPFLAGDAPLALAWGRGERMLALAPLPARTAHLALFDRGVSTAHAYAALAAPRSAREHRPRPIVWRVERLATWDDVALVASNDFEEVVLRERLDVAELRDVFGRLCRDYDPMFGRAGEPATGDSVAFTLMSGSGATVFLLSPLRDAGSLVVDARPPVDAPDSTALRIVATTTATRVAPVVVAD